MIQEGQAIFVETPVAGGGKTFFVEIIRIFARGLFAVFESSRQIFDIGFFEQVRQLGFLAGQQDVVQCQRFRVGCAAFQHGQRLDSVAVRAAEILPIFAVEYGVMGRVAAQFQRVDKAQAAYIAISAVAPNLAVALIGQFHIFATVQCGLDGTAGGQSAAHLFSDPVIQMVVARDRIGNGGFMVVPVIVGFGFQCNSFEGQRCGGSLHMGGEGGGKQHGGERFGEHEDSFKFGGVECLTMKS